MFHIPTKSFDYDWTFDVGKRAFLRHDANNIIKKELIHVHHVQSICSSEKKNDHEDVEITHDSTFKILVEFMHFFRYKSNCKQFLWWKK